MSVTFGNAALFGVPKEPLPAKGFPDGKLRIRYRPEDFAVATVKNAFGTAQYYIKEEDGFVVPSFVKAVNSTIK